ncbi:DUF2855 family protein [Caldimonas sp. KR1-144]|uniref:DUF2855 family protein n=1 Tax=Caldimonas sp. KR1-144 TaxID=3400911 RepID=UPI003C019AE9
MTADTLAVTRLLTHKQSLAESRLDTVPLPAAAEPGEVVLRLDRFALTTNNITYAAFGEAMQYWQFFPTGLADWGHMPVWGFADVLSSGVEGVAAGERFYGYFPIASHVRMQPQRVTPRGFYDGSPHRQALVSAYNQYTRCSADAAYDPAHEDLQALLRPLYITSFMLADYLADNGFFGATRLLFSSASSKTAYGCAFELREQPGIERVALTGARNAGFVARLGLYDRVLDYAELAQIAPDRPTLYVDFSGDPALRARVHEHFGAALAHDCFVGSSHHTRFLQDAELPGPKPVFFFAPMQIRKRNADWGPAGFNERFTVAQQRFYARAVDASDPWIAVVEHRGFDAARQVIAALCAGTLDAQQGQVIVL